MQNFRNFSIQNLLDWFRISSDSLEKHISLRPLSPQSADTFLVDLNNVHREIEKGKLITRHYF